jgi:tetratricopeptide (TPR) repeat protein
MFLASIIGKSQNKIYLENDQKNGKLIEITTDKVKFNNPDNPGPIYSTARSKVKLLFNENGDFLILKKLDSVDALVSEKIINDFINSPSHKMELMDKLFTIQNKQLNCTIISEDETEFTVNINEVELKIDKSSVAVIIYKGGKHKLIASPLVVCDVLSSIKIEKSIPSLTKKNPSPPKKLIVSNTKSDTSSINKVNPNLSQPEKSIVVSENTSLVLDKEEKKLISDKKKAIADSLILVNSNNKRYKQIISNADFLAQKGDYVNAKNAYLTAASLKPIEIDLQNKIDLINKKILEIEEANAFNTKYDSLIVIADSQILIKDWYAAVENYKKALELKPSDYYPQKQIKYLNSEIFQKETEDKINEEIRRKKELELKFQNAITKADEAVKNKNYVDALAMYNEALSIHPENDYAKSRAKIMEFQVSQLKKSTENIKN